MNGRLLCSIVEKSTRLVVSEFFALLKEEKVSGAIHGDQQVPLKQMEYGWVIGKAML